MPVPEPVGLVRHAPLAKLTTFELGGPARACIQVRDEAELQAACRWARDRGLRIRILGGGSNLVVHESGVPDAVILLNGPGQPPPDSVDGSGFVDAWAGADWDRLVGHCVDRGWTGIEALSGIPGMVGAAPIQNIGAYGQELSQVLESVQIYDLDADRFQDWSASQLGLGYRSSRLKSDPVGRHVVTRVRMRLRDEPPELRYRDLQQRLAGRLDPDPVRALHQVRQTVLQVRAGKSMVYDPSDPNRRSAGSFFVNPVVPAERADSVASQAPPDAPPMPRYPTARHDRTKLSAAWLIEQAGYRKGHAQGRVGLSSRHTLALVNLGGATATELLGFAAEVRTAVRQRFGVALAVEPRVWGFEPEDPLLDEAGVSPSGPVDGVGAPP